MKTSDPIIVIRKKKGGHAAHHGGAWKVAYADFVTAMMAFFLVMWIIGQSREVRAGIAGYFRDPGIFDQQRSNGVIAGGQAGLGPDAPVQVRPSVALSAAEKAQIAEQLKRAAEAIRKALSKPEIEALGRQVEITITPEGMRVELVESNEESFFDTGSAVLKGESVTILKLIGAELGHLEKPIVLEGHTDNSQYRNVLGYTNWELSTDRANAARRVMIEGGLAIAQIRGVRGYADTVPRIRDNPADARNRRISIIVKAMPAPPGTEEEEGGQTTAFSPRPEALSPDP